MVVVDYLETLPARAPEFPEDQRITIGTVIVYFALLLLLHELDGREFIKRPVVDRTLDRLVDVWYPPLQVSHALFGAERFRVLPVRYDDRPASIREIDIKGLHRLFTLMPAVA
jgi:hypothetical protein